MKTLKPIKESADDYDRIEKAIIWCLTEEIYLPLLRELFLASKTIINSKPTLYTAISHGRITYQKGRFRGEFTAEITKELKRLGAKWDSRGEFFRLDASDMSMDVRNAIQLSEFVFQKKIAAIEKRLRSINPAEIAERLSVANLFSSTISKTDRQLTKSLASISVLPELSHQARAKIADEWQTNMRLWIKDFTEEEIITLRKAILKSTLSGNRHEAMASTIQRSYGVTQRKAKFLARQETSLLMVKFKETRYLDAGVNHYRWSCVAGSSKHPVRPSHKVLNGKVFRWDDPPITTAIGQPVRRNNPGQDYNCRCSAIPIVNFREKK